MKPETTRCLEQAARNRDLARFLLTSATSSGMTPPPIEWVAVVAFYSAVHYVNAILWEWVGVKPDTHTERTWYVDTHPPLTVITLDYRQLNNHGWHARYTPGYRMSQADVQYLLDTALTNVETLICSELGVNPL